jgi:Ca2+-transporting ATPase
MLPLLPIHIIWLNVITDPLLGIALAREPKSPHVMSESPRSPTAPILSDQRWRRILVDGLVVGASALAAFLIGHAQGRSQAEIYALTLTTLALGEWLLTFSIRSGIQGALVGLRHNLFIVLALLVAVLMQLMILYVPVLARAFEVGSLGWGDWMLMIALGSIVVVVEEVRKAVVRRQMAARPA